MLNLDGTIVSQAEKIPALNKNHWRSLLASSLVISLALSACALEATRELSGFSFEEHPKPTKTTIQWEHIDPSGQAVIFWHPYTGQREETLQEIVDEFNADNIWSITVMAEYQGYYGEIFDKMLSVLNTPEAPNLVVAYQDQAAAYYQIDAGLIDMNLLIDNSQWGLSEVDRADFFPAAWRQDIFPTYSYARLGLPSNRSMEVMYYNAEWLAELGYSRPPATPSEFKEIACKAVERPFSKTAVEGSIGYELSLDASLFASWSFAFGGDVFDYNNSQYTYDGDAVRESMTFLKDLFDSGCAALVAGNEADDLDFGAGKLLFMIDSTANIPTIKKGVEAGAGFFWNLDAIPHSTFVPVQDIYGPSISIPRTTPEEELAAWLFLKFFVSPQVQFQWTRDSIYFPVRASVVERLSDYYSENVQYKTTLDLLEYGAHEPPAPGYDFVREKVSEAMAAIISGADVYQTLETLNKEANTILSEQPGSIGTHP